MRQSIAAGRHMGHPAIHHYRDHTVSLAIHRCHFTARPVDRPITPKNRCYNTSWALICGSVHPNPGQRRICQLNNSTCSLQGPPVPVQDAEAYARQLVTNSAGPTTPTAGHTRHQYRHEDCNMERPGRPGHPESPTMGQRPAAHS